LVNFTLECTSWTLFSHLNRKRNYLDR
jgi:hypothetical protein